MISCEIDLTSTPFRDATILTFEIDLPPAGNKIGFNLLNDEDFSIPCVINTTPNLPDGHQIPTQDKKNAWIIAINAKAKISLYRMKSYQRIYIEESISDQFRPVVSYFEFCLP